MWQIKKIDEEFNEELIDVPCIKQFWIDNHDLFTVKGWGLFVNDTEITKNEFALTANRKITMMQKGQTGVEIGYIIGAVVAAAVGAIAVVALTPKPEAPVTSNRSQSSATNSLGSRNNEFNIGGRIDDIWGKVSRHVPRLMQVPHFRFENNIETEHFALYLSQGKGLIENVRDGDTQFERLTSSKFNAWNHGGNPNDGTPADFTIGGDINRPLVNISRTNELQSAELLPPNDLTSGAVTWFLTGSGSVGTVDVTSEDPEFDMRNYFNVDDVILMTDASYFANSSIFDLFRYSYPDPNAITDQYQSVIETDLSTQTYKVLSVGVDFMTVEITGTIGDPVYDAWQLMSNYQLLKNKYDASSISKNFVTNNNSIDDYEYYAVDTGGLGSDPVTVTRTQLNPSMIQSLSGALGPYFVDSDVDSISFNVVADNGFYKLRDNNEIAITADFDLIVEETNSNGTPLGPSTVYPFELSSNPINVTVQAAITIDQLMNDYTYQRVSFRRTSNRDKSDNVSNVDKAILRDLYFIKELTTVPDYGNVTVAQVSIESSPAARGVKERQVNLDFTRIIEPYIGNGNFGPEAPVETIAEVVTALSLDGINGRLTLDEIDADLFLDVQQQLIDYYGTPDIVKVGYDLDSTKLRFQEIFSLFWDAVRCNAYSQGAVYRVYPNIARTEPSKQFTHRNKIIGTDTKERLYNVEFDGVELTYRSNDTGQFETVIKHVNGIDSFNRLKIELSGATQEIQAETRANFELNKIKYQKYNFSFEADGIARLTVPGEKISNVDQTRIVKRDNNTNVYNIYDDQVVNVDGLIVQLSQPVTFEAGETHSIRFTSLKGDLLEAISCTPGSTSYHVVLASSPSEPIYDGYKKEKSNFTFAPDKERDGMDVLVLGTKAKQSKGLKTRQLTAINYDSRYYQNDQDPL